MNDHWWAAVACLPPAPPRPLPPSTPPSNFAPPLLHSPCGHYKMLRDPPPNQPIRRAEMPNSTEGKIRNKVKPTRRSSALYSPMSVFCLEICQGAFYLIVHKFGPPLFLKLFLIPFWTSFPPPLLDGPPARHRHNVPERQAGPHHRGRELAFFFEMQPETHTTPVLSQLSFLYILHNICKI